MGGNVNPQIMRLRGLRRFALAITILNILGHTVLGFEQSHAQTLIALLTAYTVELLLEYVDARSQHRRPSFVGHGWTGFVDFLLPAHITGLAVSMLLYANDRLLPFVFAAAAAICSKAMFRVRFKTGSRHVFNPSNLGIAVTLLLFPAVGIAPPYMFTEGLGPVGSIAIISVIIFSGSLLNASITKRMPLILSWVGGFFLQALIRAFFYGQLLSILNAITGVAFLLFTFYMITDPGTTPAKPRSQILFGLSVALGYGVLVMFHVVFGMFFSLAAVCLARYCYFIYQTSRKEAIKPIPQPESIPIPTVDVAYR
jgi:enediyne biosynthesis protein E5